MSVRLDFTFERGKGQQADDFRLGVSQITENLFLGGEDDVSEVLPFVDVWLDLRDEGLWNRIIEIPEHVVYIRIPIADGDGDRAYQVFWKAKQIVRMVLAEGDRVLVSCHSGVSRSVVVVWWVLSEMFQDPEAAWSLLKRKRPSVEPHEGFVPFIRDCVLRNKNRP